MKKKEGRSGIIRVITKPIQFAALVVLVIEALLGYILTYHDLSRQTGYQRIV